MSLDYLYEILLDSNSSKKIQENEDRVFEMIPELKACKGFNQNNDWHIYDVYSHILHVVDNVPENLILRLAALFHDIGKPLTYKEDSYGVGHFYGHWIKSKEIFELFAVKYNIDDVIKDKVSNLIFYHDFNIKKMTDEEINRMFHIFDLDDINMLFELKKADLLSQNEKYHYLLKEYDTLKNNIMSKYNLSKNIEKNEK